MCFLFLLGCLQVRAMEQKDKTTISSTWPFCCQSTQRYTLWLRALSVLSMLSGMEYGNIFWWYYHDPIWPQVSYKSTQRQVNITVRKSQRGWWDRLTVQEKKPVFLAPDFDRWMDESDAEMEIREKVSIKECSVWEESSCYTLVVPLYEAVKYQLHNELYISISSSEPDFFLPKGGEK